MTTSSRRGFTLVELLIVIAIIGLLMGLLLPAVQAARERSRMAICNANLGELGKAMKSFALEGTNGAFPGWADEEKLIDGRTLAVTWPFKLLTRMDETTLREQILKVDFDLATFAPPQIASLNCPSDASTNPDVGTLTYVVNSGMPDNFRAVTYPSDLKANGVCHDQRSGRNGPKVKTGASDIKDGETKTILLSENIQKDPIDFKFGRTTTWLGPLQNNPITPKGDSPAANVDLQSNPEQRFGMIWFFDSASPFTPSPSNFYPINRDDDNRNNMAFGDVLNFWRFARPASAHPEVFTVAFCDGHTQEISEGIDYKVYQQLMTPNGQNVALAEKAAELIERDLLPSGQSFMAPPLNEGDY